MQVLHVIAEMDPQRGGVCQAVRTIIAGLTEAGVHNEVVSLDAPDADFLAASPFPIHALGPGQGPWSYSRALQPWLITHLSRFEVIIVHGLWLYHSYAVRKARQYLTKQSIGPAKAAVAPRLFVMPHGMLDPYFQRASGRKLKAMRNWAYWKLLESSVINEADGVLFTCEVERSLAREPFRPYRPSKEQVVGLGVEEPPAYTAGMREAFLAQCPELQGSPYLLFLSRIHEKKGVDLLIKAYTAARKNAFAATPFSSGFSSNSFPKLVIAGPDLETTYGQEMQELAATSDASAHIFFPGMLTGAAKWGAFYGCEAFVLPSHQENFGIAIVEALACGKPVLISDQVNIWKEIAAAAAGIIAEDTVEGTQKLLATWEELSSEEKASMGQRARQAYLNSFAVQPVAQQLLKTIVS